MQPQVNSTIVLKRFVDIDNDSIGWYALGHHKPKEFLAAVFQKDKYTVFSKDQIKLIWARFEEDSFDITDEPITNSQPITIVEYFGEIYD